MKIHFKLINPAAVIENTLARCGEGILDTDTTFIEKLAKLATVENIGWDEQSSSKVERMYESSLEWVTAWSEYRYFFNEEGGEVTVTYYGAKNGFLKQNLLPAITPEDIKVLWVSGSYGTNETLQDYEDVRKAWETENGEEASRIVEQVAGIPRDSVLHRSARNKILAELYQLKKHNGY